MQAVRVEIRELIRCSTSLISTSLPCGDEVAATECLQHLFHMHQSDAQGISKLLLHQGQVEAVIVLKADRMKCRAFFARAVRSVCCLRLQSRSRARAKLRCRFRTDTCHAKKPHNGLVDR
jgi:hypothetical protein